MPSQYGLAACRDRRDDCGAPGAEHGRQRRQPGKPSALPPRRQRHGDEHHRGKQGSRVRHGVGCGQGQAAGDEQSGPRPGLTVRGPDAEPRGQGEQEQCQRIKGREGAKELRSGEGGEQPGREQGGAPPVQPGGRGPQQAGNPDHEAQRQDASGNQAAEAVGDSAEGRVQDGCAGEVGGKIRDRRVVQPVGPFQVSGPQIQGLVLECRVGSQQTKGQNDLDREDHEQRPPPDGQAVPARTGDGPSGRHLAAGDSAEAS